MRKTPFGWVPYGVHGVEEDGSVADTKMTLHSYLVQECVPWKPSRELDFSNSYAFGPGPIKKSGIRLARSKRCNGDKPRFEGGRGSESESPEKDEMEVLNAIQERIEMDWLVENTGENAELSVDEKNAIKIMEESKRRVGDKYEVACLWRPGCPALENNSKYALMRLRKLDEKAEFDEECRRAYGKVFEDWSSKGYIVEKDPSVLKEPDSFYLPHFPNIRGSKIRPVFDAKAPFKGTSLNKQTYPGPNLIGDLGKILLRFRSNVISLGLDVRDMYLNVRLDERSRRYHRFIWKDEEGSVKVYEFAVHVFGNAGSPAVAVFVLKSAAAELEEECPLAAETIAESSLMDDVMDSFGSVEEAKRAMVELARVFSRAGFAAHKFCSNSQEVLSMVDNELRAKSLQFDPLNAAESSLPSLKVLGLLYSAAEDEFRFGFGPVPRMAWTRRTILQVYPRIFDPHGFVSPFILLARKIFQDAVLAECGWDDPLPSDLVARWESWLDSAERDLDGVRIRRCTRGEDSDPALDELHVFTDASISGLGAVAYRVTSTGRNSKRSVALLIGKVKVTPMKSVSMPRLELMAAELGLRVALEVLRAHRIPWSQVFFWTDAADVLFWLQSQSRRLSTFVAHRISKLQEHTNVNNWKKVPGELNPADVASRGCTIAELIKSESWWKGPSFLAENETSWPSAVKVSPSEAAVKEIKEERDREELPRARAKAEETGQNEEAFVAGAVPQRGWPPAEGWWLDRKPIAWQEGFRLAAANFSSFDRYVRVVARVARWRIGFLQRQSDDVHFAKVTPSLEKREFSVDYFGRVLKGSYTQLTRQAIRGLCRIGETEYDRVRTWLVRGLQEAEYGSEVRALSRGESIPRSSVLASVCPALDDKGVMRVAGRLANSNKLELGARMPVVLPPGKAASAMMRDIHNNLQHCVGYQSVLDKFLEQTWCVRARKIAAAVVQSCARCKRLAARPAQAQMAPLPDCRVGDPEVRESVFEQAVVDVCGPFSVSRGRGRGYEKRWVLVCVCTVYKAVHLEPLFRMDADALLQALERFVARRGRVRRLFSDNGTNFTAAAAVLREAWEERDGSETRGPASTIEWDFGPAHGAHFQGLAEAQVKAVKRALAALATPGRFDDEAMATFLVVAERLINERPITYVSSDPNDVRAVRPADFLCTNYAMRLFPVGWKGFSLSRKFHLVNRYLDDWWRVYM